MKLRRSGIALSLGVLQALGGLACSNNDQGPCSLTTNVGCSMGLLCETVQGRDAPTCLPPVVVRGNIFNFSTHEGVGQARILLLGDGGAALVEAATSAADGSYAVRLHVPRDASFQPLPLHVSPWVQASGFGPFPDRWRPAPTLDVVNARPTTQGDELDLVSADTDVFLLPFGGGPGLGVVSGNVALPNPARPVLVVAIAQDSIGGPLGVSGLADADGKYQLFGLVPAHYLVTAYLQGANYLPVPVAVSAGEAASINVPSDPTVTSTVSGRLQIAGGGRPSVALFLADTYNVESGEGDVPQGLVAMAAADGRFSIGSVPSGSYVVVPSPENDGLALVGPPPMIEVIAGQNLAVPGTIAVAPAVQILGPGANGPEAVTAVPTLTWADTADESQYHLTVISGIGNVVADELVPAATSNLAFPYGGPFAPGSFYRFRVRALDVHGAPFAASEDLRGIFYRPGP